MQYHNFKEGLSSKGKLLTREEINNISIAADQDAYISIFKYNDSHKKKFDETGSLVGIKDVTTDKLVWDFDSTNVEEAKQDVLQLATTLIKDYNVDSDSIRCYWSGNKGYHVVLNIDKDITPEQFKKVTTRLAQGLKTFDPVVSDPSRIFRLEYTKHPKSGLFKIPLHISEVDELTTEQIKAMAKTGHFTFNDFNPVAVKLPDELFKVEEKKKEIKLNTDKFDPSSCPKGWKPYKAALAQGFFDSGERHQALMVVAATCRGLGYDKTTTYYICKSALKLQAERSGTEEFSKEELYQNIIEDSIFSDGWEGGQYSPKTNPWLAKYCAKMGFKTDDEKEETPTVSLDNLINIFTDYSTNFEQNMIKTGIKEIDENVIFSTSTLNGILGQPGCHAKGTGIMLIDGSIKNVEDIKVGDLLMGPDSKPREVLKLQRGKDKMVRIIPIKGEPFIINEHHILNLKPSTGTNNKAFECNLNIMFKDYIEKTTKVVKSRYKINRVPVEFNEKDLIIPPYVLGCWLGDGTTTNPEITNIDPIIIENFSNYCKSIGDTIVKNAEITYRAKGNNFRKQLKKINVLNNKHVPFEYLTGSRQQRLELLAGLLDTDGSLEVNKTYFDFINKNKQISESVVYLCRSLGLAAYISKCEKGCWYKNEYKKEIYWRVGISGDCSIIPTLCERKQAKVRKSVKDVLVTGFTYEYLKEDDYYGFTLDKDHLYLTSDFIVHHNSGKTTIVLEFLKNASLNGIPSMFFSLDMGPPLIFSKLIQKETGYSFKEAMKVYRENKVKREEINNAIKTKYKNIGLNFTCGTTVADIRTRIQAHTEITGVKPKLIVVDYLENISGPFSDILANASMITNQLKDLATEMQVCVVLLLQTQKHSTPDISDPLLSMKQIKGASSIEQNCSVVMTLWREGYNPDHVADDKYISFAIVKNRFGPMWKTNMYWEPIRGQIRSLTEEEKEDLEKFKKRKRDAKIKTLREKKDDWREWELISSKFYVENLLK
jgi:replicative DNA helicase